MKVKNIIVGGGISGLACAKKLSEAGEEYILIERSNRVGGRVGSIYQDGYDSNTYDSRINCISCSYLFYNVC